MKKLSEMKSMFTEWLESLLETHVTYKSNMPFDLKFVAESIWNFVENDYNRLRELESKFEAHGELPFKVGDIVYTIWQGKIYKRTVSGLELTPDNMWKVYFVHDIYGNEMLNPKDRDWTWDFCIRKTKEQAEHDL